MSKTVTVKLTAGSNISSTLDLYEKVGGVDSLVASGVQKSILTSSLGYELVVDDAATHIKVQDLGSCGNSVDILITGNTEPENDVLLINDTDELLINDSDSLEI